MHENPRRTSASSVELRLLAGGLVILAALVFGGGINWGLPSHDIDPLLFGAGADSAANRLDSFHLTGVGISQLAGAWEDSANLPADVAAHPITDRSQPVTLLQNPHQATAEEIIQQGDTTLAGLVDAVNAADSRYDKARMGSDENAADKAEDAALEAQKKVHDYVADFNLKHYGDQSATITSDQVNRARILRRYRLYSFQPDEMISFRALGKMHPGAFQFDPMMYQYGGLWIYPLGAIIKAASIFQFVMVSGDPTFYLDSPENFGRMYILGRAYSAVWGIVAALAVLAIVRRAGCRPPAAFLAAICFICLPVVVDLAHEAKPHLAGAALMLLAILAADKYLETGKWKWIVWTAIVCGACAGMILSGFVALVILPVMAIVRRDSGGRIAGVCAAGWLIALAVYFLANPYVAVHLHGDRSVLQSNLSNSESMYAFAPGVVNAIRLAAAGMSWPIAIAGVVTLIALLAGKRPESDRGIIWLLAVPAVIVLLQFLLLADHKPGEYGRFAVFPDAALMLFVFIAVARMQIAPLRVICGLLMIACAGIYSFAYERGFLHDSTAENSRVVAASAIDSKRPVSDADVPTLFIAAEPAPYCLPPVNLFAWRVVLLPKDGDLPVGSASGLLVKADESGSIFDPTQTPISWADKSFTVAPLAGK